MLKKKIYRAEEIEAAKAYLRGLSINDLSTPEKRLLAKNKYEHGDKFTNTSWGIICSKVTSGKSKSQKQTKRRKHRVKGKRAIAAPVTSDNSAVVPMAGRAIGTNGSVAEPLIILSRMLPAMIAFAQATDKVLGLTGEEQ